MKEKYLFYFCDGVGSVFDSQILELLNAIAERKVYNNIKLFVGIRNISDKNILLKKDINPLIEFIYYKSYPNYPFYNYAVRNSLRNALNDHHTYIKNAIIHARGELISWHLSKVIENKYIKNVLPDIRGASIEEVKEFYNLNFIRKKLKIINYKKAVKNLNLFNTISVVSDSLKKYLANNHFVDQNKVYINPSIAGKEFLFKNFQRNQIRNELNLKEDDILIVFSSGGISNWQNNEILKSLASRGLKVLNLSRNIIKHDNIINKFVTYSEMPLYLSASDVAIIWRVKSIVNEVASPVKFSEYICCGLPVISNDAVTTIKNYLKNNSVGLLLNDLNEIGIESLRLLIQQNRYSIAEQARDIFGIHIISDNYLKIHSKIF